MGLLPSVRTNDAPAPDPMPTALEVIEEIASIVAKHFDDAEAE